MSIHINFSNSLLSLSRKLSKEIKADTASFVETPFKTTKIYVPNPNLKQWLNLSLARFQSIVFNIEFEYLETGLWKLLINIDKKDTSHLRFLDKTTLQSLIVSWLKQSSLTELEFKPFYKYLTETESPDKASHTRRLWQLAGKLAFLLLEYEYHRQDMVLSWLKGEKYKSKLPHSAMYYAQQKLYKALFDKGGQRDQLQEKTGTRFLTLVQYNHEIEVKQQNASTATLHFFGLSSLSPFHRDILLHLGKVYQIQIYQFNVCSEFWEDISTPYEDKLFLRWDKVKKIKKIHTEEGEMLEEDPLENALLKVWGKPGREAIKIFGDLEDRSQNYVEFTSEWLAENPENEEKSKSKSILKQIQTDILSRSHSVRKAERSQDTSLQILACPSIYREIETIYNSIIWNLEHDQNLFLNDIAILVPSISKYKPVIQTVFEQTEQIPYSLIDSTAAQDSLYGQALLALIDLASGNFTRREIFDLINNPCFRAGQKLSFDDAQEILKWVNQLHIYRGYNSISSDDELSQNSPASFTFKQGMLRLRLGRIMVQPDFPPLDDKFLSFNNIVPYGSLTTQSGYLISKFSEIVEKLFRHTQEFKKSSFVASVWADKIEKLMDDYLQIPNNLREEAYVRDTILSTLKEFSMLEQMGIQDNFSQTSNSKILPQKLEQDEKASIAENNVKYEFHYIREFISHKLDNIPSSHGTYLSGGISVASLLPMRPIPFKIIYVTGLGEGDFPGSPDRSSLDIRRSIRKIGDVNKSEGNCYLFLETLMSVQSKLYLSYVSDDLQKDQKLYPGSIINELIRYVKKYILLENETFKIWDIPLKGSSLKYLQPLEDSAATDVFFNPSLTDRILAFQDIQRYKTHLQIEAENEKLLELIEEKKITFTENFNRSQQMEKQFTVTLHELKNFLENPLETQLKKHLKLYDEEPTDVSLLEDEPLYSVYPLTFSIKKDVYHYAVKNHADADKVNKYLHDYYKHLKLTSDVPYGAFGDIDLLSYNETILQRVGENGEKGTISEFIKTMEGKELLLNVTFGESRVQAASSLKLPPLKIQLKNDENKSLNVELHGSIPFIWKNKNGKFTDTLIFINKYNFKRNKIPPKQCIEPFLFFIFATISEHVSQKEKFRIWLSHDQGIDYLEYSAFSKDFAKSYISNLISELLINRKFEFLPFHFISKVENQKAFIRLDESEISDITNESYLEKLNEEFDDSYDNPYSLYHPSSSLKLIDIKFPKDSLSIARKRFKPFITDGK